jgi:hypothetical protein
MAQISKRSQPPRSYPRYYVLRRVTHFPLVYRVKGKGARPEFIYPDSTWSISTDYRLLGEVGLRRDAKRVSRGWAYKVKRMPVR